MKWVDDRPLLELDDIKLKNAWKETRTGNIYLLEPRHWELHCITTKVWHCEVRLLDPQTKKYNEDGITWTANRFRGLWYMTVPARGHEAFSQEHALEHFQSKLDRRFDDCKRRKRRRLE